MKIKVFIFFTFLALAIASLQLSVFADETQKEHVQNMTLVNKPEKLFTAQGVYKNKS
ncbi:MAG: hypothetical protein IPM57_07010 [Oligoflexia bacterium]|nr:hypothetical protein [Oligoflexia bacterium]